MCSNWEISFRVEEVQGVLFLGGLGTFNSRHYVTSWTSKTACEKNLNLQGARVFLELNWQLYILQVLCFFGFKTHTQRQAYSRTVDPITAPSLHHPICGPPARPPTLLPAAQSTLNPKECAEEEQREKERERRGSLNIRPRKQQQQNWGQLCSGCRSLLLHIVEITAQLNNKCIITWLWPIIRSRQYSN